MHVVVKICARGNDPVHESSLHERDDRGFSQARRSERAGERHADDAIADEHFAGEKAARFGEAAAVVGLVGGVDEIGHARAFADRLGEEARELFVQGSHARG